MRHVFPGTFGAECEQAHIVLAPRTFLSGGDESANSVTPETNTLTDHSVHTKNRHVFWCLHGSRVCGTGNVAIAAAIIIYR